MKQGIDVSKWQPKVDWQKVKADGIDFAIIRVGFCYNNGALKLDSAFTQHIKGALAAGLDVGVYLYSYATTVQAARRAAQEVIKAVKPYKLTYPIAFDIEYESIYTGGSKQTNTEICKAFLEEVEQAASLVQEAVHPDALTIFGATFDETLDDEIRVTVIATGFDEAQQAANAAAVTQPAQTENSGAPQPLDEVKGEQGQDEMDKSFDEILRIFNKDKF